MKALVGAFNQEKALVGAFSVIVKTGCGTDGSFYSTSFNEWQTADCSGVSLQGDTSRADILILLLLALCPQLPIQQSTRDLAFVNTHCKIGIIHKI